MFIRVNVPKIDFNKICKMYLTEQEDALMNYNQKKQWIAYLRKDLRAQNRYMELTRRSKDIECHPGSKYSDETEISRFIDQHQLTGKHAQVTRLYMSGYKLYEIESIMGLYAPAVAKYREQAQTIIDTYIIDTGGVTARKKVTSYSE